MKTIICFVYLAGVLAVSRLIPHPPNFTPIIAMAIFVPYMIKDQYMAIALPLLAMFISDLFIGLHQYMIWVYGSIMLCTLLSMATVKIKKHTHLALMTLLSSVVFYLITNFGVWLTWDYYPKTIDGLIACYTMAIPFFKNTLFGTITYTMFLMLGSYVISVVTNKKEIYE